MIQSKLVGVAGLILAASVSTTGSATVLLSDNFDGYAGQPAFESVWTPTGTTPPNSGVLTSLQANSLPNSILNPGTAANGQSRNRRFFPETPTLAVGTQLVWSFDFFDAVPSGAPHRNYSNLQDTTAPTGANQLISMGLNNNQNGLDSGGQAYMARIVGYTPTMDPDPDGGPPESGMLTPNAYFKLNDFPGGLRSLGWHNLKTIISTDDGASTDYEFYVDGVLAERVSNIGSVATIRQYDNIILGSGLSNANNEVYFDNMNLEFIEPASDDIPGDFDDDGDIDLADYLNLSSHLFTDVSMLTPELSYAVGDFTRDLRIDGRDFGGFCKAFDNFNGVGALEAMLAAIPEPSGGLLAVLGGAGGVIRRRRTTPRCQGRR